MKEVNSATLRQVNAVLHDALLDLMAGINSPQSDAKLLERAGVSLDRGLYPLLVRLRRRSAGITDLADQVGREQSTVSRQIQSLEEAGLVVRGASSTDRRSWVVSLSSAGRKAEARIARTREQLTDEALHEWDIEDRSTLASLLRKLADAVAGSLKRS